MKFYVIKCRLVLKTNATQKYYWADILWGNTEKKNNRQNELWVFIEKDRSYTFQYQIQEEKKINTYIMKDWYQD